MEKEFRMWLTKMYYENCQERDLNGEDPYDSVDAYYQQHPDWLRKKFKEFKGEK